MLLVISAWLIEVYDSQSSLLSQNIYFVSELVKLCRLPASIMSLFVSRRFI